MITFLMARWSSGPLLFPFVEPLPGANWVNDAGKVLSFDAFFKEAVNESAVEQERVRKVVVYYYLEDDTMQIVEHKQENSSKSLFQ